MEWDEIDNYEMIEVLEDRHLTLQELWDLLGIAWSQLIKKDKEDCIEFLAEQVEEFEEEIASKRLEDEQKKVG